MLSVAEFVLSVAELILSEVEVWTEHVAFKTILSALNLNKTIKNTRLKITNWQSLTIKHYKFSFF